MRGRLPVGPEYVDKLDGSALAKERARALLETMTGDLRLQEACERLGICEQRFHQVRKEAMQGLVAAMEPGQPGRPAPAPADDELRTLRERVAALEMELIASKARAEISLILPRARQHDTPAEAAPASADTSKKKRRGRPRKRPPPPGPRTNT